MIPFPYDITIEKGATYQLHFYALQDDNETPYYFVGTNATKEYSCRMQIRRSYLSENKLIDLSTEPTSNQYSGDTILFSQQDPGLIKVEISAFTTKSLPPGKHFYDIELEDNDGVVFKLLKGRVEIVGEITR
jgi:hypothetical protein